MVDAVIEISATGFARLLHARRHAAQVGDPGRPDFLILDRCKQRRLIGGRNGAGILERRGNPTSRVVRSEYLVQPDRTHRLAEYPALLQDDPAGRGKYSNHGCSGNPQRVE